MIVVNTIPQQRVQLYPCPHFHKVYDIFDADGFPLPVHEINQLLNGVHSKGNANLHNAQQKSVE